MDCFDCESNGKCSGPGYIKKKCTNPKAKLKKRITPAKGVDSMRIGMKSGLEKGRNLDGDETEWSGIYGPELMLDCHGCDLSTMTKKSIKAYFEAICKKIEMQRDRAIFQVGEKMDDEPFAKITAIQFILTSNITVHTVPKAQRVYVNIFSCKDFDESAARFLTWNWFKADTVRQHTALRG